jgi:paraquat-inducible protein B
MSAKANYFKLGMFIIVAVALAIGAVLVLGAGKLFQKKFIIETYLDQSVQGVEVGSKVKYRGVPIGNIRRISFTRNHYAQDPALAQQHSYVLLELELTSLPFGGMNEHTLDTELPKEVRHGLRTRITSQGVTGTSYIEIDYLEPDRYPALPIDWEPANPYIPSAPSALSKIVNSAEEVFTELQDIEFARIAADAEKFIAKLGNLPFAMLGTNALELLVEVRDSNRRIQQLIDRPEISSAVTNLSGAVAGMRRLAESPALTNTIAQLERTLLRVDQVVAGKDDDLTVTLDNLRALTENLRELSENAKRFPAQLLFGQPPKPSEALP